VVDMLVSQRTGRERALVLRTALGGGGGPGGMVPAVKADELARALSELITGMEQLDLIPDWALLMRLCAAREMVRLPTPDPRCLRRRWGPSWREREREREGGVCVTGVDRMN
jgi:hypothetical protein